MSSQTMSCSDAADLFQAFEEQAKVLKEMNDKIAALESSLSAKDMELHVEVGTISRLELLFVLERGT